MNSSLYHELLMSVYYAARQAQEERAEDYSHGYKTERDEFYRNVERKLTFKEFLIQQKRENNG